MSNSKLKKGIRWWIFKFFGPQEVQSLVKHIDKMTNDGEYEITIYSVGEFKFSIMTSMGEKQSVLIFDTSQERQAFSNGLNYGVKLLGGDAQFISQEDAEILDNIQKKSTHGGGSQFNN